MSDKVIGGPNDGRARTNQVSGAARVWNKNCLSFQSFCDLFAHCFGKIWVLQAQRRPCATAADDGVHGRSRGTVAGSPGRESRNCVGRCRYALYRHAGGLECSPTCGTAGDGGAALHQLREFSNERISRVRPKHVCFAEVIIRAQDGDVLSERIGETVGPVVVTAQDGNGVGMALNDRG